MIYAQAFYESLSDAALDDAYAREYDSGTLTGKQNATTASFVIGDRRENPFSFSGGLFLGSTKFPKYEARGGFHQAETARDSTVESAINVASDIGAGASWLGSTIFKGTWPILIVVALVAIIVIAVKFKKA